MSKKLLNNVDNHDLRSDSLIIEDDIKIDMEDQAEQPPDIQKSVPPSSIFPLKS